MNQCTSRRVQYVSALNVLSCLAVVILHCNGVFWSRPGGRLWISANFLETFFYFAVPIFFMISGVTLLDYPQRYSTKEYFGKRLHKAVIPFLAWSMVGFLYQNRSLIKIGGGGIDWNPLHILDNIVNTRYVSIYWFFIPLFAVYLTIPFLANLTDKMRWFRYGTLLGFVFVAIMPLVCSLLSITYNGALTPSVVRGYSLFLMLGYLLAHEELEMKTRWIIYGLGVLGWGTQFLGTMLVSPAGEINSIFKGYLNLPCVLQACGVFVFLKYNTPNWKWFTGALSWFSKRTFGIYLVHIFLVWEIPGRLHFSSASILWRTAGAGMIFLLSAGIVWLLQKVPGIKRIVP